MAEPLKSSAQRVQDCLSQHGCDFTVREFTRSTRTAQDAADALSCDVGQIAKSLIFKDKGTGEPVLVVASGSNRVDTKKIKAHLGIKLSRVDADYVREHVGYAIGGVPPVAHNSKLTTILDIDLQRQPTIWAAAGTPNAMFEVSPEALVTLTEGSWLDLAE